MQDLKVYIVIENTSTRQDVSIKGDLEVLRALLSGVGTLDLRLDPAAAKDPKQSEGQSRVTAEQSR